jgi:hypothetical protein
MPVETEVNDAIAALQKANTTDGSSLYESLTKLVVKVSGLAARTAQATALRAPALSPRAQVLDQKPDNAVDLLETALLAKKAGGDQQAGQAVIAPVSAAVNPASASARPSVASVLPS